MSPDLVVLGNLLVDDVVHADGRTRMAQAGGATLYVALAARLWGIGVGIVSRVGDDYPEEVLAGLAERGVDLAGVRRLDGPGLRTWLLDEGSRRQVVHRLAGPTHADVSPTAADLPAGWNARAFHLAPMPREIQQDLAAALGGRQGTLVSLDPYEILTAGRADTWRRLVGGVDLLFLSEDEMLIDGALDDPRPVLAGLAGGRLRRIFCKRGARGGLVYDTGDGGSTAWPARAEAVVDPTGAGDAFAGGTLAGWLLGDALEGALERGVVSASFALAGEGARGLLAATGDEAAARRAAWFGVTEQRDRRSDLTDRR